MPRALQLGPPAVPGVWPQEQALRVALLVLQVPPELQAKAQRGLPLAQRAWPEPQERPETRLQEREPELRASP